MANRVVENKQNSYICGQCNLEILYSVNDEPPHVCPECNFDSYSTGWTRQSRKKYKVPPTIKLDITKY